MSEPNTLKLGCPPRPVSESRTDEGATLRGAHLIGVGHASPEVKGGKVILALGRIFNAPCLLFCGGGGGRGGLIGGGHSGGGNYRSNALNDAEDGVSAFALKTHHLHCFLHARRMRNQQFEQVFGFCPPSEYLFDLVDLRTLLTCDAGSGMHTQNSSMGVVASTMASL